MVQPLPGHRPGGGQAVGCAGVDHLPAVVAGARADVDDVVGQGDDLGLVLDDEDGAAAVAQLEEELVHPGDVVRVQPDGGLVEDVGDVGEGGAEVAHHLHALPLPARERPGRPVEGEVAQPDVDHRAQHAGQTFGDRGDRGLVEPLDPGEEVTELLRGALGQGAAVHGRGAGGLVEPGAVALGARAGRGDPFLEPAHVRLLRLHVPEPAAAEPGDQALVGHVDAGDLDLGRRLVQQPVPLLVGVVAQLLVGVDPPALGVAAPHPAADRQVGRVDRALGERAVPVEEGVGVDPGDRAQALAGRAHATDRGELADLGLCLALLDRHLPAAGRGGQVEGEGRGRPDVRLGQPAEDHAQVGEGVGGGADRGAGVGADALLVDDDGGGEVLQVVHLGPGGRRHERLHEGGVGLVDEPLGLGGDRAEDQGGLARAGDARDDGQPALGQVDVDAAQVVDTGVAHADRVVGVGGNGHSSIMAAGTDGRGRQRCPGRRTTQEASARPSGRR
ncbi:hypothetical protein [Ornithinimicrobium kibberense]|uniref:hypothetical protein n=1 Tax=Ornithinimicrobium kibberense TaxID=282060 RepID=UPI00361C7035